ncbi:MAG: hypothetical protein ACRESN_22000, partial [Pseudomonas sp.]
VVEVARFDRGHIAAHWRAASPNASTRYIHRLRTPAESGSAQSPESVAAGGIQNPFAESFHRSEPWRGAQAKAQI